MAVEAAEINSSNVFEYRNEVIVELHGRTENGELVVITYQFDPADEDPTRLTPRERIEGGHRDAVTRALRAADYSIGSSD